jgi:hypothetical protein
VPTNAVALRGVRVLVADGNAGDREPLAEVLQAWGCDVSRGLSVPVHQYDCFNLQRPTCASGQTVFHEECVGTELVFWGYRLGDGRTAFLFACAPSELVNCDERVQLICLDGTNVIRNPRLTARSRGASAPTPAWRRGRAAPGLQDNEKAAPGCGLVSCG